MKNLVVQRRYSKFAYLIILAGALGLAGCQNQGAQGPQGAAGPAGPNGSDQNQSFEYNTVFTYQKVAGTVNPKCNWSMSVSPLEADGTLGTTLTTNAALKTKTACTVTLRYNAHPGDWLVAQVKDPTDQLTRSITFQAGGSISGTAQTSPVLLDPYTDAAYTWIVNVLENNLVTEASLTEAMVVALQTAAANDNTCSSLAKQGEQCTLNEIGQTLTTAAANLSNLFMHTGFAVPSTLAAGGNFVPGVDHINDSAGILLGATPIPSNMTTISMFGTPKIGIVVDHQTCLPLVINSRPHEVSLTQGIQQYAPSSCKTHKSYVVPGVGASYQAVEGVQTAIVKGLNISTEVIAHGNGYANGSPLFQQRNTSDLVCVNITATTNVAAADAGDTVLSVVVGQTSTDLVTTEDNQNILTDDGSNEVTPSTRSVAFLRGLTSRTMTDPLPISAVFAAGWDTNYGMGPNQDAGSVALTFTQSGTGPDEITTSTLSFSLVAKDWVSGEKGSFCVAMLQLNGETDARTFNEDVLNATGAQFKVPNITVVTPLIGTDILQIAINALESRALYASSQFLELLAPEFATNTLIGNNINTATAEQRQIYETNLCTGFLGMSPLSLAKIYAGSSTTVPPLIELQANAIGSACFGRPAVAGDVFTVTSPNATGFVNRTITVSSLTDLSDARDEAASVQ